MKNRYINQDIDYITKNYKYASVMMFFMGIFTLISFLSPYWVKSKIVIDQDISNMGLWEICFNDFRNIQMIRKGYLDGCKRILSNEISDLKYWFLPNWLKWVQFLSVLNFGVTFSTLFFIMISIFTRLKKMFLFIIFITILIMILGR
jgi:hypothetical protein